MSTSLLDLFSIIQLPWATTALSNVTTIQHRSSISQPSRAVSSLHSSLHTVYLQIFQALEIVPSLLFYPLSLSPKDNGSCFRFLGSAAPHL